MHMYMILWVTIVASIIYIDVKMYIKIIRTRIYIKSLFWLSLAKMRAELSTNNNDNSLDPLTLGYVTLYK